MISILRPPPVTDDAYEHAGPAFFTGRRPVPGTAVDFDPEAWEIRSPEPDTVETILKANDVKYTTNSNPTSCPVHDKGPVQEALLKQTADQLKTIFNELQLLEARKRDSPVQLAIDELKSRERKLEVEQQALVKVVAFYKQHLEQ